MFCTKSAVQVCGFGRISLFQLANEKKMDPQQWERKRCPTAKVLYLAARSVQEPTVYFCPYGEGIWWDYWEEEII